MIEKGNIEFEDFNTGPYSVARGFDSALSPLSF